MKSRNLIVFVAVFILAICLIWRFHRGHPIQSEPFLPENNLSSNVPPQTAQRSFATQATNTSAVQATNDKQIEAADREKKRQAIKEQNLNEWKTPIEFYGIVEDESNNMVAGAKIDFECNDLSAEGTSFYQTHSDANGAFSIKNITGKLLRVTVSKAGYYSYQPNGGFFYYAGQNQNFVPDSGNPVIFHLREKGNGTNLIHYDRSFSLLRDGTPILIDLPSGRVASSSQNALQVEGWTYDSQKKEGSKYDWKCLISVPGGGLQTNDEQFPFLAPESDYVSEDVINMPVTNSVPWSYIVHRNYYVHTADGKYGRMAFTMVAGGGNFCEINLYFNPSGSPNLEPAQ